MYLSKEDIRIGCGRRIIFGFDGTSLSAEVKELLREVQPSGLILFRRNIESVRQVAELNREIKLHCKHSPLLLTVDQEGGRVARIPEPAVQFPPMRRLGERNDPALARALGQALAEQLRTLNFDLDYAPVVDVDTNPKNPVIGDRSFHQDPKAVAALAAPFIKGMQRAGVAACAKHFPGHGDTNVDSHLALPTVEHPLPRLREVEWPPFAAAIEAGVSSIMTAHVMVPDIDSTHCATLSPTFLRKYLREELKFKGIVISDDIEMKALADHHSPEDIARLGLMAGIDVFLACHAPETTLALYRALVHCCEQQLLPAQELADRHMAIRLWQETYYKPPLDPSRASLHLATAKHGEIARAMA